MAMTAREAAWTALQRWRKNGAWSDAALNAVLQGAQLEPRDAALAARICYGTLQNLTLLDHYLSVYCTTPLQKLEPKVLDLLRLSAYQIVLLDKVPPRAAVNEAVALCRKGGCARASGLVNAVLRRVAHGQSPMHADRSHIHHRLIDMGLNQKQAVATLYVISAILGLSAAVAGAAVYRRAWLCICRAGAGGEQCRCTGLPAGEHAENDGGCSHCIPARRRRRDRAAPVASERTAVPRRQSGGRARLCRWLVLCAGRGRALRGARLWRAAGYARARCLRRPRRQKFRCCHADARSGMYDFLRYSRK